MAHALHGFTAASVLLAVLGSLYISYEVLGHKTFFKRFIRIIGPGLTVALPCAFIGLFLGILQPSAAIGPFYLKGLIGDFVIYGGIIGTFYGIFSPSDRESLAVKRGLLTFWDRIPHTIRDAMAGFIIASLYWLVTTFVIFNITYYDSTALWSKYLGFAIVGIVGGIFWRPFHSSPVETNSQPRFFNLKDSFIGIVCWLAICILTYIGAGIILNINQGIVRFSDFTLLETAVIITLGGITSGFSRYVLFSRKRSSDSLALSTPILSRGGFIASCYRLASQLLRPPVHRKANHYTIIVCTELAIWLTTWLLIGFFLSFIFKIPRLTIFYSPLSFLVSILFGTAVTLLAGFVLICLVRLVLWVTSRIGRHAAYSPVATLTLEPGDEVAEGAQRERRHFTKHFLQSLVDCFIQLITWHELWFVFAVCMIAYACFPAFGIPVIILIGIATTAVGESFFSFILGSPNHLRADKLESSTAPNPLVYPLVLPIMWLGIWIISVTIFFYRIGFNILPSIFFGSAIAASLGVLAIVLLRLPLRSMLSWRNRRGSNQSSTSRADQKQKHTIFSRREALFGLMFWSWAWLISTIVVSFTFYAIDDIFVLKHPIFNRYFVIDRTYFQSWIWIIAVAVAGAVVGGFSEFILGWLDRGDESQVLVEEKKVAHPLIKIGIMLTIVGFLMQLVEPTLQLIQAAPVRGHSEAVLAVAWSPDGKRIASAGVDETVQVWNIEPDGTVLTHQSFSNSVYSLAWSPDGKFIASGSFDMSIQIWDAATGSRIDDNINFATRVYAVAWSPDGNQVVYTGDNGTVKMWQKQNHRWSQLTQENSTTVYGLAWSPNGLQLAVANKDGTIGIWDMTQNSYLHLYHIHRSTVYAVSWSPDGKYIASASEDRTVQVWEAATGKIVHRYLFSAAVHDVKWSSDGKRLASACEDGTIQVLNLQNGSHLIYRGHLASVNALSWSPHDNYIASASDDKTVKVWDPTNGDTVLTYGPAPSQ